MNPEIFATFKVDFKADENFSNVKLGDPFHGNTVIFKSKELVHHCASKSEYFCNDCSYTPCPFNPNNPGK